ncbi:MAG TPA: glycosyltransferase [Stellaceae bacterium]|nr:glycosyltransferase [Stellaceae bacterium]
MSAVVVVHEASRTGAPRMGGLIAAGLRKYMDVRLICLHDGPLLPWLEERVGADKLTLLELGGEERPKTPFAERVALAQQVIEEAAPDIVYVNSAAASEFVVAGKAAGLATVLHVHEKAEMLRWLLRYDLVKLDVPALCDGVVLAAGDLRGDLAEIFGFVPERCLDFGIAVDPQEIARLAAAADASARNAGGRGFTWGSRPVVGMVGHASERKGADIFFEAAAACPEHDFVWVGNWDRATAPENPVFDRFAAERLPNLYVAGAVDNPYAYIARFDLFFLSSREDPNPVVLAEALTLGVPVLAFSRTTAVGDFLGRSGILCHGTTNTQDAVRVLQALDADEIRSPQFRGLTERYRDRFDITKRVGDLVGFLGAL